MISRIVDYLLCSVPVPFRLSWGKLGYSRHVFLVLEDKTGKKGVGEGVLYKNTHLNVLSYLEKKAEELDEPAFAFAMDSAQRDLAGKIDPVGSDKYSITREIFLEDGDLESKVRRMLFQKTGFLKLKVGSGIEQDKKTIARINRLTNGKLPIRVDANRAYSLDQAVKLAQWGSANNVILFEEPIKGSFSQVKKFKDLAKMPVMLDESIQTMENLNEAISYKCFDVLNVKLTRLGGISGAQPYIEKCQRAGVKLYLGCSEELDIGNASILTLAGQIKDLYGLEGFGSERLGITFTKQDLLSGNFAAFKKSNAFIYSPRLGNRGQFLAQETWGIWKTRAENLLLRLWPS